MADKGLHPEGTMLEDKEKEVTPKTSYDIIKFPTSSFPNQYKHLVFSRWLRSLRYGNILFRKIKNDSYFKNYHLFLERLFQMPDSEIRFAVLPEDHDFVLGFSVRRRDILDYVHIHTCFRKQGIAKCLVDPATIKTFTHITNDGMYIWRDKYTDLQYDPFA